MITFQEQFYHLLTLRQVLKTIILPAQAFFSHRPVEALDIGLFVLAIRSGNTMTVAECINLALELSFEFRASVGLKQIHMTAKSPPHALVEEPTTIFCR